MTDESLSDFIAGEGPAGAAESESPNPGAPPSNDDPGDAQADRVGQIDAPPVWQDTITFDRNARLYEFDTSFADAYSGWHESAMGSDVVVLVSTSGMPFRMDLASALRAADKTYILPLLEAGAVREPKNDKPVPALCYLRPKGNPLVESTEIPFAPLRDDLIIRDVITPMVHALDDLRNRRIFHGRINPANMFRREGQTGVVQLGDCIAGPPGYDQPLAFETINRCMADPIGKGAGTIADDLYALGVSIAVLCLGEDPFAQFPSEVIVEKKLAKGTYAALIGQKRIPSKLMEPVRGLLTDDAAARWQLDDLSLWLSGRRLSPKQATTPTRASRPIRFGDQSHSTVKSLADALSSDVPAAIELLDDGRLDAWIRRTIGDEQLAESVENVSTVGGSRAFRDERRVARVSFVLDGEGPIRYRGRSVMPDGIGWTMAEAHVKGRPLNEIADFIESGLVVAWFESQGEERANRIAWCKAFERHRSNLLDQSLGVGVERTLYDLNPDLTCQSPLLDEFYVPDVPDLVRALEQIASRAERPPDLIDRHIAAFMLSRNPRITSLPLRQLSNPDSPAERGIAVLTQFADLQRQTGIKLLPNLANWVVSQLEPVLDELFSHKLRTRTKDALLECASRGSIPEMLVAARNKEVIVGDKAAFAAAQREYWVNEEMARRKEDELKNCRDFALTAGHQYAVVVSGLLAVTTLATVVLQRLM